MQVLPPAGISSAVKDWCSLLACIVLCPVLVWQKGCVDLCLHSGYLCLGAREAPVYVAAYHILQHCGHSENGDAEMKTGGMVPQA